MKIAINDNGTLRIFKSLPIVWKGKTGIHKLPKLDLMVLGFFNVYEPKLKTHEKYGELTVNDHWGNKYILPIISMTQEEIDEYKEYKLNTDASAVREDLLEKDGIKMYINIRNKMKRAHYTEKINDSQFKLLRRFIKPIIAQLKLGDWDLVLDDLNQILIDNTNIPTKLKEIIEKIITSINGYLTNNPM